MTSAHNFHLVDPSPWPLVTGVGSLSLTTGGVLYMNGFSLGGWILLSGFTMVLLTSMNWFSDMISEGTYQGHHTTSVKKSLKIGMILFIVSEVMFFSAFFWAYFHSALSRAIELGLDWRPVAMNILNPWAIPLLNTVILLSSGVTVTWAHHSFMANNLNAATAGLGLTILLAMVFTMLQGFEYVTAGFTIADSVYGSTFFMATGFHGLHVAVGTVMLTVQLISSYQYSFSSTSIYGFEASSWYWHFVDVVWLFLFISVYWWGSV